MSSSGPFKLTIEIVRDVGLMPEDVGAWCLIVDACYHVFASEAQAKQAYDKLQKGILVR